MEKEKLRTKHCSFNRLNCTGKCIAPCHYNIQSDSDCVGNTGKTSKPDREIVIKPGHKIGVLPTRSPEEMSRDNMRSTLKARIAEGPAWGASYTMKSNLKK
jgi:hypothetical protein